MIEGYVTDDGLQKPDYDSLSEADKEDLKMDEVICIYLREVSRKTNELSYMYFMRFALLFYDCINSYPKTNITNLPPNTNITDHYSSSYFINFVNYFVCEYYERSESVV